MPFPTHARCRGERASIILGGLILANAVRNFFFVSTLFICHNNLNSKQDKREQKMGRTKKNPILFYQSVKKLEI